MATRTASAAKTTAIIKQLRVGCWAVSSTFSIPAGQSISAGDVIQMIAVPANAQVVFVGVRSPYVQATIEVGDALQTNRYLDVASTSAEFSACMFGPGTSGAGASGAPYTYSTDDTIDILTTLVSVSSVAGAFYLTAILTMDPTQYN